MTDYTKMVERLREIASVQGFPTDDLVDAADAIEAVQSDRDQLQRDFTYMKQQRDALQAKCAGLEHVKNAFELQMLTLQAKLDVLQTQDPVAYGDAARRRGKQVGALWQFDDLGLSMFVGEIIGQYNAAPKAPTHEQVEEAWRAGWAACRDAEYVGQEAEDEAWGMSETCANADWENAAPKALEPLTLEQIKEGWAKLPIKAPMAWSSYIAAVRFTEKHHGITKGTP